MVTARLAVSACAFGQQLVVTAEGHRGTAPVEVMKDNISVAVNRRPAQVEKWIPLRGDQARLDLYIVIDDGEDSDLGSQFSSLKAFMHGQPGTARIGLAYLRNGAANIVAPLTTDHDKTARALRLPLAQPGISASPYMGISDLVKKWPTSGTRREVLLISSGIDPYYSPPDQLNPYLLKAIEDAQRAGILIHSIYFAEAGHLGHSYWQINWGQNYLSELGDETGGEAYWQGLRSPVSFDPYLKDLASTSPKLISPDRRSAKREERSRVGPGRLIPVGRIADSGIGDRDTKRRLSGIAVYKKKTLILKFPSGSRIFSGIVYDSRLNGLENACRLVMGTMSNLTKNLNWMGLAVLFAATCIPAAGQATTDTTVTGTKGKTATRQAVRTKFGKCQ